MRCPKCGFHTFDHAETCKKCSIDLRPFKTQNLTAPAPSPVSAPPAPFAAAPAPFRTSAPPAAPPAPVFTAPLAPPPLVSESAYAPPAPPPTVTPYPAYPVPTGGTEMRMPGLPGLASAEERTKLEGQAKNGAGWFYWIAALSVINSVILLFGGTWNFVIGLGVTSAIGVVGNVLSAQFGGILGVVAFVFTLLIAGIFVLFGVVAGKGKTWGFVVGMTLYLLDSLLCLAVLDFFSAGFHALALFFIFRGFQAQKKLGAMGRAY